MKKIGFLLIMIGLPLFLIGQTRTGGGMGYFMVGPGMMQWDELNTEFPAEYPELENTSIEFGGGGFFAVSNFIIGGEGGGLSERTFDNQNYNVTTSGGFGMFQLGYMVFNRKNFTLYPLVGYGGKDIFLKITEDRDIDWNELVANPRQSTELQLSSSLLDLGIGFNYFALGGGSEKGYGGFSIGLRAGYQMAFEDNDWKYDNGDVYEAPDFDMSHFYVRLTIGGGGFGKY
ncbi:MAG: hypothetical protein K9I94_12470 [Bacteroidales bacterium]|nr:hypothetical protein [Bacteroidales bacterium]